MEISLVFSNQVFIQTLGRKDRDWGSRLSSYFYMEHMYQKVTDKSG
ncbi:hypothetical protein LEMLEM_LOCUS12674, partial [Lemmus lemmus]